MCAQRFNIKNINNNNNNNNNNSAVAQDTFSDVRKRHMKITQTKPSNMYEIR